jgi:hypothetical protein
MPNSVLWRGGQPVEVAELIFALYVTGSDRYVDAVKVA